MTHETCLLRDSGGRIGPLKAPRRTTVPVRTPISPDVAATDNYFVSYAASSIKRYQRTIVNGTFWNDVAKTGPATAGPVHNGR